MENNDKGSGSIERWAKLVSLFHDVVKAMPMAVLAFVSVSAIAAPGWVNEQLQKLGLRIAGIEWGGLKLVATETASANANALVAAEQLTRAEVQVASAMAAAQESRAGSGVELQEVADYLKRARMALEQQSVSLHKVAYEAGAISNAPVRGWIYVGYFSENGKLVKPSDRLAPDKGVRFTDGKVTELVLKFDASVDSNGADCSTTKVEDFVPPDPAERARKVAILRASAEPLKVLTTSECDSVGRGKTMYAQVEVPQGQIRFAALTTLPR